MIDLKNFIHYEMNSLILIENGVQPLRLFILPFIGMIILILPGCGLFSPELTIYKVGMLVEGSVQDHQWNQNGYNGLLDIEEKFDVNVLLKENIRTKQETLGAVEELIEDGANLIFGHSSTYGKFFADIASDYPDTHFIYFNGDIAGDNLTSLNFNAHAMGFFAGMVASKMTQTNQVSMIAAHEWQPEVEGFYEGVKFLNPGVRVQINFVNSWDENHTAVEMYHKMREEGSDVFYPAGDSFSEHVIKLAADDGIYAIGYGTDQSSIHQSTVLTSTIQHVDQLYTYSAEQFNNKELEGDILTFDFKEDIISLGEFSPDVPESFRTQIKDWIEKYKETNLLPNEQ